MADENGERSLLEDAKGDGWESRRLLETLPHEALDNTVGADKIALAATTLNTSDKRYPEQPKKVYAIVTLLLYKRERLFAHMNIPADGVEALAAQMKDVAEKAKILAETDGVESSNPAN